jgi:hypothetical protein
MCRVDHQRHACPCRDQCGQLRDRGADKEIEHGEKQQPVTEPFAIPELELERPDAVLAEAITRVRQERVQQHLQQAGPAQEDGGRVFSDEELSFLYQVGLGLLCLAGRCVERSVKGGVCGHRCSRRTSRAGRSRPSAAHWT